MFACLEDYFSKGNNCVCIRLLYSIGNLHLQLFSIDNCLFQSLQFVNSMIDEPTDNDDAGRRRSQDHKFPAYSSYHPVDSHHSITARSVPSKVREELK